MELAAWFSQEENRPRRSLLFIAFSGEEIGLLGSIHYTNKLHPGSRSKTFRWYLR